MFKFASIISKLLGLLSFFTDWVKEYRLKKQAKQEQKLENLEKINDLHTQAEDINNQPDMDKQQQLDWMRRNRKNS